MYNRLIRYLDKYEIVYNNQYGFREKHSTSLALLYLHDKITSAIDKRKHTIGGFHVTSSPPCKIPGFSGRRHFNRLVPTPFFWNTAPPPKLSRTHTIPPARQAKAKADVVCHVKQLYFSKQ